MMGGNVVLDSNIIIDIVNNKYESTITSTLFALNKVNVSTITFIEALAFADITPEEDRRIRALFKKCRIVSINRKIRDIAIDFRKATRCETPDSLIGGAGFIPWACREVLH